MNNIGSIIFSTLRVPSSGDTHPIALSNEIKGGIKSVLDTTERNNIPTERKELGNLFYVQNEKKYYANINGLTDYTDISFITGGTYNSFTNTLALHKIDGNDISISGFSAGGGGGSGERITGGTFDYNTQTLSLITNSANTISVTGFYDKNITGGTFNSGLGELYLINNSGETITITGITDTLVTGGTFDKQTGELDLVNSTGGTVTVTGFTFDNTFVTGGTYSNSTGTATFTNNTGGTFNLTGITDTLVTGGTYTLSAGTATFRNNTGGTFNVSGFVTATTVSDISELQKYVTEQQLSSGATITWNRDLGHLAFVNLGGNSQLQAITGSTVPNATYQVYVTADSVDRTLSFVTDYKDENGNATAIVIPATKSVLVSVRKRGSLLLIASIIYY